jgi:O-antigen/teichoic acid export membrane protein
MNNNRNKSKRLIGVLKKNKVATAGMGYVVGSLLIKGIAFISTPIFARMLKPSDFGLVNSYLAYESFIAVFIGFLFYGSVKSAKYTYKNQFAKYMSNIVLLIWMHTFVILLVANIFMNAIVEYTGFGRGIINLLVLNGTGTALTYTYNVFISLRYKYKQYILVSAINAIFNVSISILLIQTVFSETRYVGRILGYGIPLVILMLFFTAYFFKMEAPSFMKEHIRFAYRYCVPLVPSGLSDVVLSQFSRLSIQRMVGDTEMGIYSLSYSVYSIVGIVRNSLDMVWGPWFFERMGVAAYHDIRKRSVQYAALIASMSVVLMLFSPEIIMIMGSPAYFDARFSVIPLISASYFVFLYSLPMHMEYYYRKTLVVSIGSVGAAVANIIMNLVFIKLFGYQAAAYCTLAAFILISVFHFVISYNLSNCDVFDLKKLALISTAVLIMSVFSLAIINHQALRYICILAFGIAAVAFAYKFYLNYLNQEP